MKSIVSEKPCESEIKYPCLMTNPTTGTVVLMRSFTKGTIIIRGSFDNLSAVGEHCEFPNGLISGTLFKGSVCLEND
jgi:hypothetical protein